MTINEMFARSVLTKSTHPGFIVSIYGENDGEIAAQHGPYSRGIADEVFDEFTATGLRCDIMDAETGEVVRI